MIQVVPGSWRQWKGQGSDSFLFTALDVSADLVCCWVPGCSWRATRLQSVLEKSVLVTSEGTPERQGRRACQKTREPEQTGEKQSFFLHVVLHGLPLEDVVQILGYVF